MLQEDDSEYEALVEISDTEYEQGKEAFALWQEVFANDVDPSYVTRGGDKYCIFCDAWLDVGENPHEPNCTYIRAKKLIKGD